MLAFPQFSKPLTESLLLLRAGGRFPPKLQGEKDALSVWEAERRWYPKPPAALAEGEAQKWSKSQGRSTPVLQVLGRAEGTGCSRGGTSSDRNLNYVVTQALGSLGLSFTAQPDLLQLDLGSVSRRGRETRAGLFPRPPPPTTPQTGGKAEEVGKGGGKADSKKGERSLVFPSLPAPRSLLGRGAGWGVGCSFQLPPWAPVYLQSACRVPSSVLSSPFLPPLPPPSFAAYSVVLCHCFR